MGKVHALNTNKKNRTRSTEREALAVAIARYRAHVEELAAVEQALGDSQRSVLSARRAHEEALAGVEKAKEAASKHMTATLLGRAGKPPVSIKEARAAVQEAGDDLEIARTTQSALEERLANMTRYGTASSLKSTTDAAAIAVLKAEVDSGAVYERFVRSYREFTDARALCQLMEGLGLIDGTIKSFHPEPAQFGHASSDAWKAAILALAENPDASLPPCIDQV